MPTEFNCLSLDTLEGCQRKHLWMSCMPTEFNCLDTLEVTRPTNPTPQKSGEHQEQAHEGLMPHPLPPPRGHSIIFLKYENFKEALNNDNEKGEISRVFTIMIGFFLKFPLVFFRYYRKKVTPLPWCLT